MTADADAVVADAPPAPPAPPAPRGIFAVEFRAIWRQLTVGLFVRALVCAWRARVRVRARGVAWRCVLVRACVRACACARACVCACAHVSARELFFSSSDLPRGRSIL